METPHYTFVPLDRTDTYEALDFTNNYISLKETLDCKKHFDTRPLFGGGNKPKWKVFLLGRNQKEFIGWVLLESSYWGYRDKADGSEEVHWSDNECKYITRPVQEKYFSYEVKNRYQFKKPRPIEEFGFQFAPDKIVYKKEKTIMKLQKELKPQEIFND
jgi:hypothetical protein